MRLPFFFLIFALIIQTVHALEIANVHNAFDQDVLIAINKAGLYSIKPKTERQNLIGPSTGTISWTKRDKTFKIHLPNASFQNITVDNSGAIYTTDATGLTKRVSYDDYTVDPMTGEKVYIVRTVRD